ncbi:hypothetical protein H4219_005324 [Mycoemilia scoparia]|uniref:UspA domain-containing protein n=1 Tax=Mycoemilia scoparia TaxID=417184 RepID=A0A9W7ZNE6_9FUNG|nr:hypothetical protein H4219_005324 [Mycoemilia scoparia]
MVMNISPSPQTSTGNHSSINVTTASMERLDIGGSKARKGNTGASVSFQQEEREAAASTSPSLGVTSNESGLARHLLDPNIGTAPIPIVKPKDQNSSDFPFKLSTSAPRISRHLTVGNNNMVSNSLDPTKFSRIITVAINSPNTAVHILSWAMKYVLRPRRDLIVLTYVYEPKVDKNNKFNAPQGKTLPGLDSTKSIINSRHEGRELLTEASIFMEQRGFVVKGIMCIGDPRVQIIQEAKRQQSTFLIVGSHNRGAQFGNESSQLGDITQYLVRKAEIPIFVVQPKFEKI